VGTSAVHPSPALGRLCIVAAAVLWSSSGAFTKVLRESTPLGLNDPLLTPLQIACCRVLFAGAVLLPLLSRRDLVFRPAMLWTAGCFALLNALFISATALGKAANAILLQYTATLWLYIVSVTFLGEKTDGRGLAAVLVGLCGVGVIIWGGWEGGQILVILCGLGSGVTYAAVVVGLRMLRGVSPIWLTVVNHLFGGLVLLPLLWGLAMPTWGQLLWLCLFGGLQMGLPYLLMARGLRSVSPQEAGTLTLLEPILNPILTYLATLAAPLPEVPSGYTFLGGAFILGALAYRYWPRRGDGTKEIDP
jgi:drug/metabolite transporter (DMT)-like permease